MSSNIVYRYEEGNLLATVSPFEYKVEPGDNKTLIVHYNEQFNVYIVTVTFMDSSHMIAMTKEDMMDMIHSVLKNMAEAAVST